MTDRNGKYKKLLGNTMIFGVGQFLTKIIGFLLVIIYTHFMSEKELSTSQLVYQTVNLLVPLVTFSMRDAVIRFGMDKGFDNKKVYTNACAALFLGMAVLAVASPLIKLNDKIGQFTLLLYIYCYFSCFRDITSTFTRSRGMVKLFMVDGVLTTIVQVLCNVIFIIGLKLSVNGYILSFIISDLCSIVFLFLMGGTARFADTRYLDAKVMRKMLSFSVWLIPTYILWWVTSSSDQWFIVHMVGDVENGIYGISYKLPTLLMFVTTMFYQAWQMSSIEERDNKGLGKFYQTVFGSYSSLLFIAAAGIILFVKPLTFILTGDGSDGKRFYEAFAFTPILVISMVFQCFCQFLSSVYTTTKRSVNSLTTALVAALTNIVLNLLLIRKFGLWGAAIATAFSYVACFLVRLWDVRRYIWFKVNLARFGLNSIIVMIMSFIAAKEPPLKYVWLSVLFVIIASINFGNVVKTVGRLLKRRR
ncbi:MAG: polysaccharide biosynthesis C-terminal domain-containing protein [Oscillospiraceae bacterium]|nr:polysaccharide biosynthesis C-terminal domain-containing protein [Oscillospiraceae bacterium]